MQDIHAASPGSSDSLKPGTAEHLFLMCSPNQTGTKLPMCWYYTGVHTKQVLETKQILKPQCSSSSSWWATDTWCDVALLRKGYSVMRLMHVTWCLLYHVGLDLLVTTHHILHLTWNYTNYILLEATHHTLHLEMRLEHKYKMLYKRPYLHRDLFVMMLFATHWSYWTTALMARTNARSCESAMTAVCVKECEDRGKQKEHWGAAVHP